MEPCPLCRLQSSNLTVAVVLTEVLLPQLRVLGILAQVFPLLLVVAPLHTAWNVLGKLP